MANVALIEAKPSRTNYNFTFEFDRYSLTSDPSVKRVLKKNIDIEIDIDKYDWIILVGSEPLKEYTNKTSVMDFSGKLVNDKFLPVLNPAMLKFKPEVRNKWEASVESVKSFVDGSKTLTRIPYENYIGITTKKEALKYIQDAIDHSNEYVGVDSETSALYPRDGYVLGISISYKLHHGAYIDSNVIDDEVTAKFQELFDKKIAVFHNAKFDLGFLAYHFGFKFPRYEDTMLIHYALNEKPGTHGLKQLAIQYTLYGEYEAELHDWVKEYCKTHGVLKSDFTWDKIPFDVMYPYAAIDPAVTLIIFSKFWPTLVKNEKLLKVYKDILIPGTNFVIDLQNNGIPFDKDRLELAQTTMNKYIDEAVAKLESHPKVAQFIAEHGEFNPNSVVQLRKLLFEYVGLKPTHIKTSKGLPSTNSEVLEILSKESDIPQLILTVRKYSKIKNTYIDKIINSLNKDGRLRTNFNLHSTTSGRLSSSGKLNAQQLPRDEPSVKGCIKALPGYKIVSMDLTTAEVYVAACLAGDTKLQDIFRSGGDFHGRVAHTVFKLKCEVEQVKDLFPDDRQAAKAVTFGIMYGAGPNNIAEQITIKTGKYCSPAEAKEIIEDYFAEFKQLRKWIDNNRKLIQKQGFVYSHFGRKRRLENVFSDNRGTVGHEIRSGLNFLVQSPASDINLIGAIECNSLLASKGLERVEIVALVHDSVIAHVPEELVEPYCELLKKCIQTDRGIYIPGCPIGCDLEIGEDYSFGKFEKLYNEIN